MRPREETVHAFTVAKNVARFVCSTNSTTTFISLRS